jgi:hypothetical protein
VAERLMMLGLEAKKRKHNHRALRAFCFLVETLGKAASSSQWLSGDMVDESHRVRIQESWLRNPFRYEAFRQAVSTLLEMFKPPGEIESPLQTDYDPATLEKLKRADVPGYPGLGAGVAKVMQDMFSSPEKLAEFIIRDLWLGLSRGHRHHEHALAAFQKGSDVAEMIRDELYGLEDARADLNLRIHEVEDEE